MPQLSYKAYVAVQLIAYAIILWQGLWSVPGVLSLAGSVAAVMWNWERLKRWAFMPDRDARGRFKKGKRNSVMW